MAQRVLRFSACLLIVFAVLLSWHGASSAQTAQTEVALELVLAMDTSSSVIEMEFDLQRRGMAEALRHREVLAAIESCGGQAVAIAVVQWSGNRMHLASVDWTLVWDQESAGLLADKIEAAPRLLTGFTGLGGAIRYGLQLIEENGFEGRRKIIDISGDGSSSGLRPDLERDRAVRRGATINGLAILNEEPDLSDYYAAYVIGGPGAFVMDVVGFETFAEVFRIKLAREIRCPQIAGLG